MNDIKYPLLSLHVCSSYADILLCTLITPYFFLPAVAGFPIGFLEQLGVPITVQVYIGFVSIFIVAMATVSLFENRLVILKKYQFSTSTKCINYGSRFIFVLSYMLPVYLFLPDQEQAKLNFLSIVPCPTEEFFYSPVFFLIDDPTVRRYVCFATGFFGIEESAQIVMFASGCVHVLFIKRDQQTSRRTKKLQIKFFCISAVQVTIPLLFILFPFVCMMLMIGSTYYNQAFTNILVLSASVHGFVSTTVMLTIHKPYQDFILGLLGKKLITKSSSKIRSYVNNA